jgi:hypothetical protein
MPRLRRHCRWGRTDRVRGDPQQRVDTPRPGESAAHSTEQLPEVELEFGERSRHGAGPCPEQVQTRWQCGIGRLGLQHGPQLATQPIAHHGRPHRSTERKGDARARGTHFRRRARRIEQIGAPQHSGPSTLPFRSETRKVAARSDAPDQADRRCRPLARRLFSTSRPARVLIRARKPCFFARRRLLGW